ncbi:MAG TPA: beta-ketoacyl-ACP synthase II [Anaerovoracaceae bacterium]|nr:beta-ketoacyl-ACP synthase II [Anaerovoracaceae bacterium]
MSRRVVITGLGTLTPIGNSVDEFWKSLKDGKVGIDGITKFDTDDFDVKLAGELKDFNALDYLEFKESKRMEDYCRYAVVAAMEALKDSNINMELEDPYRAGCIVGSGVGSMQRMRAEHLNLINKGPKRVKPLFIPMMISNMAAGNVSIKFGLKGKCTNVVTACATGTHCIGDSYKAIKYDDADIMVAGGTESTIDPLGIAGFSSMNALSTSEDRLTASIPFDKDRTGFVLGEGAGIVVLEELEHALKRNAKIYAEVLGYGATSDAYHITSPCETGEGAAKAMEIAIKEGGITPSEIDYINAHGTSTKLNDKCESKAINTVFGINNNVIVNSTKSMTGHMLGAAGAVECIVCAKSIEKGYIHKTAGTNCIDEECEIDVQMDDGIDKIVRYAISNSLGFGGHNASLLLGEYED